MVNVTEKLGWSVWIILNEMLSKELDGDKILFLFKNEGPNKNTKTFS